VKETLCPTSELCSEHHRKERQDELFRRLFQMTVLDEASIRRIVDLVEEIYG